MEDEFCEMADAIDQRAMILLRNCSLSCLLQTYRVPAAMAALKAADGTDDRLMEAGDDRPMESRNAFCRLRCGSAGHFSTAHAASAVAALLDGRF